MASYSQFGANSICYSNKNGTPLRDITSLSPATRACSFPVAYNETMSDSTADEEWRRVAAAAAETQRLLAPGGGVGGVALRTQAPLGAPLILSPRMSGAPGAQAGLLNGGGAGAAAGLLSPGEPAHQLIYASPYADYANYAALTAGNPLLTAEYAAADHTGGLFAR